MAIVSERPLLKLTMQPSPTNTPLDILSDPVIEAYKKDVDRTLLFENLKLSVAERSKKFENAMRLCFELRKNAKTLRSEK